MSDKYKLYTWSVSLYSAKARAYLIKQHIDYDDISPADPHYDAHIRPAIGRWIIPVMETPDDEIVQDGVDIIDWFESRNLARLPAYPTTPRHLVSTLIMEMFGGEGMLRPAMHYRWNFDADNLDFILQQFGLFAMPQLPAAERRDMALHAAGRMRKAA
ncbi:MAG: glutathione S-transferase, partial [Alphaproteobacteria bacterium]|nr:glutathione S-transferase [Alphaproteobacteria bacterium]